MERDFLGLNSMEPSVKQEIPDEETHWPFIKTVSSFPHFTSFRAGSGQDDGINKKVTEPIKSSNFMHRSTADVFDGRKICSMDDIKNFPLTLSNHIMKPGFVGFGQNVAVSPPTGQVVGFTEPWNNTKSSAAVPQMTIFYGGTVSVYEGISPEKAQAIMLLAGNGSFLASDKNLPSQVPLNVADLAGLPNPLSVSSHASKDEQMVAKTTEISLAPVSKPENERVVPLRGSVPMSAMTPSVVPQFRKASLARFLEKRKERVMSTGPYTGEKKQPEGGIAANSNARSAANSGTSPANPARRS